MNPARLHALFNAYLRQPEHRAAKAPAEPAPEERSLSAFFLGGG